MASPASAVDALSASCLGHRVCNGYDRGCTGVAMIRLYIGKSFIGVTVREDATWPGMWRVHSANGQVSDMANLSRAKDAAICCARPRGLGGTEIVRWNLRETVDSAPPMRSAA